MLTIKEYVVAKKEELAKSVLMLKKKPVIKIIQVNDDYASNSYIKGKIKDVNEIGCDAILEKLPDTISEADLLKEIEKTNNDSAIDGFIVQLPLPKHISEERVKLAIDPKKDLDGFNPLTKFVSATPNGIITFLSDSGYEFKGKNALVIGRSNIVGKPMAKLLLNKDMTVTVAHSKTPLSELKKFVLSADLIIVAVGKRNFLDKSFNFKDGAYVIDVGINRDENNKLTGDCEKGLPVKFQSPVPGGVGLLTRLALLINLVEACK